MAVCQNSNGCPLLHSFKWARYGLGHYGVDSLFGGSWDVISESEVEGESQNDVRDEKTK